MMDELNSKLDKLINGWREESLSSEELRGLNDALSTPEGRARLREDWFLEAVFREALQTASVVDVTPQVQTVARRSGWDWIAWFQPRSLAATAVGVLFGLLGASAVWAMSSPQVIATASRLFNLHDGSFEKGSGQIPAEFPQSFGIWAGDDAEVVASSQTETAAFNGNSMLRFNYALGDASVQDSPANSCDVYQLVDLRSLKTVPTGSDAALEMSAQFLDLRAVPGEEIRFTCRLYVFSGTPDSLRNEWPLSRTEALALGSGFTQSQGGAPHTWRRVTAKVLLPPQADFAIVQVVAGATPNVENKPAEFGKQFVDDAQLILTTHPSLPVRMSGT